jgi:hypothetical protein
MTVEVSRRGARPDSDGLEQCAIDDGLSREKNSAVDVDGVVRWQPSRSSP